MATAANCVQSSARDVGLGSGAPSTPTMPRAIGVSPSRDAWAPAALDRVAKDVPIHGIDVRGLPWTEIDFPEDLVRAEKKVWPAIAAERNHHIFAQRTGAASVVPFSRTANR